MALLLLLAFIVVPLVEIAVFIQVGGAIGTWPTVALVILTAIAGTWLIRLQGLSTLARAEASLQQQNLPVREIFDGVCLLLAGALLLTPGFVTDALGFALLLPPVRLIVGTWLLAKIKARGGFHIHAGGFRQSSQDDSVIDGDFTDVTGEDASEGSPPTSLPPGGRGWGRPDPADKDTSGR